MNYKIPLMRNAFLHEQETKEQLADFIRTADKLSMGEQCRMFEEAFAGWQGRKYAVLVNSGSSANLLLIQALKNIGRLKDGDAVGYSALTWSTNVMPLIQLGLRPVPIDCELETLNASSRTLAERLAQADLKAFFLTNVLGFAGDLAAIRALCQEHGILLIEDNCEGLGTQLPEGRTGNFGLAATFSFFVAHHMSTIEGGMVATDDPELAQALRIARANGWDRNLPTEEQMTLREQHAVPSELYSKYTFYDLAFNFRPTEITGFLGLVQLAYLDDNIAVRGRNHLCVAEALATNPDFIPVQYGHLQTLSPFAMPFIVRSPEHFARYTKIFTDAGIEIRPMIAGNMQTQPFHKKYIKETYPLPNTEHIHNCGFYCGNYPELTAEDLAIIRSCIATVVTPVPSAETAAPAGEL